MLRFIFLMPFIWAFIIVTIIPDAIERLCWRIFGRERMKKLYHNKKSFPGYIDYFAISNTMDDIIS